METIKLFDTADIALAISVLSLIITIVFSSLSHKSGKKAQKLNEDQFRKIEEDSREAQELAVNPSWFAERMRNDHWLFGLVTNQGQIIPIKTINSISNDGKWLEVELVTSEDLEAIRSPVNHNIQYLAAVADDRRTASVQVSNIVMAFELVTS
ncbi:hypothetical protein N9L75_02280 [Porticoccaceae bacterium]|nr:hypothetical protein [Porticoccaceae bacterium]